MVKETSYDNKGASKKLLVTGCARSGTKYTADLLTQHKLDVRHEHMGRDGIVTWTMAADDPEVPFGESFQKFKFDHVFHQVRAPLPVIRSMITLKEESWAFIARNIDIDPSEQPHVKAARYWHDWNELAERRTTLRFRIEYPEEVQALLFSTLGLTPSARVFNLVSPLTNTRSGSRLNTTVDRLMVRIGKRTSPRVSALFLSGKENAEKARKSVEEERLWTDLVINHRELALKIAEKALYYGYPNLVI